MQQLLHEQLQQLQHLQRVLSSSLCGTFRIRAKTMRVDGRRLHSSAVVRCSCGFLTSEKVKTLRLCSSFFTSLQTVRSRRTIILLSSLFLFSVRIIRNSFLLCSKPTDASSRKFSAPSPCFRSGLTSEREDCYLTLPLCAGTL